VPVSEPKLLVAQLSALIIPASSNKSHQRSNKLAATLSPPFIFARKFILCAEEDDGFEDGPRISCHCSEGGNCAEKMACQFYASPCGKFLQAVAVGGGVEAVCDCTMDTSARAAFN
jgi:hypothetical protein